MKNQNQTIQFTVIAMLLAMFSSCSNTNNTASQQGENGSFYTIPFDEIVKNKREVKLSEFASDIELIQLENTNEALLKDVENIEFTQDYILIKCWQQPILQFDRSGKFIQYIGAIGNGPGEYGSCMQMSIDEESERVYICSFNWDVLVYDFEGEFIKSINYQDHWFELIFWGRDSLFVSYAEPMMGNELNVFTELNEQDDTLQGIPNYILTDEAQLEYHGNLIDIQNYFYRYNNKLHLKSSYNDTVYTYNDKNKFAPKFLIDLGKYKLPEDLTYEKVWKRSMPDNLIWTSVYETPGYVFIPYGYHYDPDKPDLKNEERGCVLYNKNSKEGVAIEESKFGGFIDDFMGCPDFRPSVVNGNTAMMMVTALDMKEYLDSEDFREREVQFPEKKEELKQKNETLNEGDNNFLVVVTMGK